MIAPLAWAKSLALIAAGAFILCFIWGSLLSDVTLQELHRNSLRIYLMDAGFVGTNLATLIVGTIVSAIWGLIGGGSLGFCLKHCSRKSL